VLDHLAQWARAANQDDQALELADEALALRRSLGDELGAARALANRGVALWHLGQLGAAESTLNESIKLFRRLGDALGLAGAAINLGRVVLLRGDVVQAGTLEAEGLTISRARGVMWGIAGGFMAMSQVLQARGEFEQAARLVGCTEAVVDCTSIVIKAGDQAAFDDLRGDLRDKMGASAFELAIRAGRALPVEEAIDLAISVGQQSVSAPADGGPSETERGQLSRREREIAAMVARGDTNSKIAAELSLSRRTVDTHVSRILQKRGVSSRSLLAGAL
jgi:DNA-binding CsgD family transcriptional regulator